MALKTNFTDDILAESMDGKRQYNIIENSNGTKSLEDVTDYQSVGSTFSAKNINETNEAVNNAVTSVEKLTENLTASDNLQFKFGKDGDGNYGYYGADGSLVPFNSVKDMTAQTKYYASQNSGDQILTYEIPENKPGFMFLWEDYISTEPATSCCTVSGCTKVFTSGALYHMQYDEQKLSLFRFNGGETITINRRAGGTRDTKAGVYVCIIY
jgi:hypothetical protein